MAGYQTQQESTAPQTACQTGNPKRALEPALSYDHFHGLLPQLGDLLPIDTQLLSPSLARAFNLPMPSQLAGPLRSNPGQAPLESAPGFSASPPNASVQRVSNQLTAQQASPHDSGPTRGPGISTVNPKSEPDLPSNYPSRARTFPSHLADYGLQQQIQSQFQQYQQRGEALRNGAGGHYEPSRSLLEQERLQQLAHQYASAAASYGSGAAAQPSLRPPAIPFQPLSNQPAQAGLYAYADTAHDAQAAAVAQYAGAHLKIFGYCYCTITMFDRLMQQKGTTTDAALQSCSPIFLRS